MKKLCCVLLVILSSFTVVAQLPDDDELAMQHYQTGDWEKAFTRYQMLFNEGRQPQYYDQYLNTLLKLRKYEEAQQVVSQMIKAQPDSYVYKVDYGRIFQDQGRQEKAGEWYNKLIKELTPDEYHIRDLAVAFYRASAYNYSIRTLLNGRKLLKDESAFSFDLLSLYRYQKDKQMLVNEYLHILGSDQGERFLSQAKSSIATIFETGEDYSILKAPLLRKMEKEPGNTIYSDLLVWTYIQQKDYSAALKQVIATDKRLREDGGRVYDLALLIGNEASLQAIEGLEYLIKKGPGSEYYIPAKMQILKHRMHLLTGGRFTDADLIKLEDSYTTLLKEAGKGKTTVFAMRELAKLQAYYLNKPSEARTLLEEILKMSGLPASVTGQIKLELGDVYILTDELWEAALIYGQAEKEFADQPIGQEAKYRKAKLSYYQADFAWAKAQLDVLKSSTSQLIANDALNLSLLISENTESLADTNALIKYALADKLIFAGKLQEALSTLDSIDKAYPGNSLSDDILMSKSKVFLKQNNLQKAVECLLAITELYSYDVWADDALFILAETYETKLHDPEKAKMYYQKLITAFPGSLYVTEARKRFRNLRGDNVG
ncbi:tetratricopeptide repeat protein [Arcticibacter tournemirensis]